MKRLVPLLLAVLLVAPACSRKGPDAAQSASVIALIGDEPVEEEDFGTYVRAAAGAPLVEVSPQVASSLLDQYLEERLLQKAVDARRAAADGGDGGRAAPRGPRAGSPASRRSPTPS